MNCVVAILGVLIFASTSTSAFQQPRIPQKNEISSSVCNVASQQEPITASTTVEEPKRLSAERYIATNRFNVRPGKEAAFEKRWATRKSRLSTLDGFKYFHLMRRVSLENEANSGVDPLAKSGRGDDATPLGNYVSFTTWQEKKHFNAWRSGEAFKEAHGGTSITAFLGTMINSARVMRGPPRPAFYDGLLQLSLPPAEPTETVDGWRTDVNADGSKILPAECLVACNQFFVPPENAAAFEQRWAGRESSLKECEGFVAFALCRRDVKIKGHGVKEPTIDEPTYVSTTIWKDRDSFAKWREGGAFKKAHGQSNEAEEKNADERKKEPPLSLWSRPPVPVFYEGVLVINTKDGF